jgi:hypothetical protein
MGINGGEAEVHIRRPKNMSWINVRQTLVQRKIKFTRNDAILMFAMQEGDVIYSGDKERKREKTRDVGDKRGSESGHMRKTDGSHKDSFSVSLGQDNTLVADVPNTLYITTKLLRVDNARRRICIALLSTPNVASLGKIRNAIDKFVKPKASETKTARAPALGEPVHPAFV